MISPQPASIFRDVVVTRRPIRRQRHARIGFALAGMAMGAALLAGCGGASVIANQTNSLFALTPGTGQIDTNCSGCNSTNTRGNAVHQFSAILNRGGAADVTWSVAGGDPVAGPGTIDAKGQYSPPGYLTADRVQVMVTATLKADPSTKATSSLLLTPGFLQPLTPENVALGANGTVTVTGILAEAGGGAGIHFALADTAAGTGSGQGVLGLPVCQHDERAFTSCSVTYTAPSTVSTTSVTYIVATAGEQAAKTEVAVLLNSAGVTSNPAEHQTEFPAAMLLGSSGGNNNDYDAHGNRVVDCCGGTLGALLQDDHGKQYLLSNNHVLARSDHATVGDDVVQPGLIDNNCTPNGDGAGTQPVGSLTGWLPLSSRSTNADAAIAEVASHSVDPLGSIQELGTRQADGTLAAAPLGVSSTGGKGEPAQLQLRVAKSGRTTGLTCGGVSAVDVDVAVDYYRDCAETRSYLTKTFTHQIGITGNHLSDAGDSGALLVDTANAEPVGLYFAGGSDALGVSQGLANPVSDVLNELDTQVGNGATYAFVGGADHAVSCLSYGDNTTSAAQARSLSDTESDRAQHGLNAARSLIDASAGILGVAAGKSSDHPGEAAVIVYVAEGHDPPVPATVGGVRTLVIPASTHAVTVGEAPTTVSLSDVPALSAVSLNHAIAVKDQNSRKLMQGNTAIFGVGVGQSLDNPREAALIIYVDRRQVPPDLPQTVGGLRTHYVVMDRFHVTRSYAVPFTSRSRCSLPTERRPPAILP
ncbi:MAG TPA: hypothetical protein VHW46_11650 [Terracidiphilus sp.]|nr:hypothetical protein [Terracidiphilus sp.]